jgi:NRPS condensation-like uncharacterized protein
MSTRSGAATGQDWANQIARIQDSNSLLHIIAEFEYALDHNVLEQAVLQSLQVEPVLACRFDDTQAPPCWTPIDIDGSSVWLRITAADSPANAIRHFVEELPLEEGRQLLVQLIHGPAGDALCMKLDHACCDGGGAKAYLQLLCGIYNRLYQKQTGAGGQSHGEDAASGFPERSSKRVYEAAGIQDIRQAYKPEKDTPLPSVTIPFQEGTSGQARYAILRVPFADLRPREEGTTINDMLLAALTRVLAGLEQGSADPNGGIRQTAVNLTIDLRRYFPSGQQPGVCNLSGMEKVAVPISADETFGQTVKRVHETMAAVKVSHPGLHSAVSMDFLARLPYPQAQGMLVQASSRMKAAGQSAPIFSNLGWISSGTLQFGEAAASRVYAITPAMHAPAFMLGASSYGGELTLAASYFEQERSADAVRLLLEAIADQLI